MSDEIRHPVNLGDLDGLLAGGMVVIDNKAWEVVQCDITAGVYVLEMSGKRLREKTEIELRLVRVPWRDVEIVPWLKGQIAR